MRPPSRAAGFYATLLGRKAEIDAVGEVQYAACRNGGDTPVAVIMPIPRELQATPPPLGHLPRALMM